MHEQYIESLRVARMKAVSEHKVQTLKQICLKATSRHMDVLHTKVLDLPTSLIKDLLLQLNIVDLDRIEPALKLRGISTSCKWIELSPSHREGERVQEILTEDEWRQKTMHTLFHLTFFGFRFKNDFKIVLGVNFNSLLLVMAKYVQRFNCYLMDKLRSLTADQRPVLSVLEMTVHCVVMQGGTTRLLTQGPGTVLYVLHRLLDHGVAGEVELKNPEPSLLTWILHSRRSESTGELCPAKRVCPEPNTGDAQRAACLVLEGKEPVEDEKEFAIPCKRPKLTIASLEGVPGETPSHCQCMDPEHLCQAFTPSAGEPWQPCPQGQIHSLKIKEFGDDVFPALLPLLPTWRCLRSLSLKHQRGIQDGDVFSLAQRLKQLSEIPNSLTDLSVGSLSHPTFMKVLLDACPNLRSFSVEIAPTAGILKWSSGIDPSAGLLLENLSVKIPQVATNFESLTCVLKRSPNLTSLHVSGIRIARGLFSNDELLNTVSESNQCLKKLSLEDMNLADHGSAVLHLLGNCRMLEELSLKDCRLLEKCSKKDVFIQQLIGSLKRITSLRALNLSRNRLAKHAPALGELFTGASPSTVKELDISCSFILPPELLELARVLESNHPPQNMVLDLRSNPLDRDTALRDQALHILRPLCHVVTDRWNSRASLADHISNM